ncbi:MAG: helix-turn-helix transcriptional regulator [Gemmatimonadota bacterium]
MPTYLGEFEQLVLLALVRLADEGYGVAVHDDIQRRTGRDPSLGTVYTTLSRLEAKGFIRSRLGEPSAERGGRRKKFFAIEPAGHRALSLALGAIRQMSKGLNAAWGER